MNATECTVDWLAEVLDEDRTEARTRVIEAAPPPLVAGPPQARPPERPVRSAGTRSEPTGEPRESRREWLAVASLLCGLAWGFGIGSFVALVLGYNASRALPRTDWQHRGIARTGIALGWAGVAIAGVLVVRTALFGSYVPALNVVAQRLSQP